MSHGYDHIMELEWEQKQDKLNEMSAYILRMDITLEEADDMIWMFENRKKIRRHKKLIDSQL